MKFYRKLKLQHSLVVWPTMAMAALNPSYLPHYSYMDTNLKSCYRWVTDKEKKKWKKRPYLPKVSKEMANYLSRVGKNKKISFCWSNPITAVKGGINESYGKNLMRIDLADDYILYDRNLNKYYQYGKEIEPTSHQRKGVDSQVVYALYRLFGGERFQEYAIRSTAGVKSWSFDDPALVGTWKNLFSIYQNDREQLRYEKWHFLKYTCPSKRYDYDSSFQRKYCKKYDREVLLKNSYLQTIWKSY